MGNSIFGPEFFDQLEPDYAVELQGSFDIKLRNDLGRNSLSFLRRRLRDQDILDCRFSPLKGFLIQDSSFEVAAEA